MEEPLEIPIMNDLTMVLGDIVDFTEPSAVYGNVKQATAFDLKSVVYVHRIKLDTIKGLSAFCEKARMQAAISASFHYNNVEIVESGALATDLPSPDVVQIANNLSNLGQINNKEDISTDVLPRDQVLGEDGVRVHSMVLPGLPSSTTGLPSSTTVYFSGPQKHLVYGLKKFL
ncbi:dihydrodipicolinate reductase-like protein CRR1, chloroplastic [Durio zibethinus]|uniref:Dihydrodipicolinate reductase-like protein CRR1, chloroplastic n=1 Tax=Durio zibethinus TaxID=66656 RepID=A0A6P5YA18_DURZI|nr:dihydrodipicolinate reductase-like protein CRR1, chloroplastic [Durio zibethinus]